PLKPAVTVVTVQGIVGPGVMIETGYGGPKFTVQKRAPSNTMVLALSGRLLATVVTTPAGCDGAIEKRPGPPEITIRPIANTRSCALVAPVQVSRSLPSLPRTRKIRPSPLKVSLTPQTSAPSDFSVTGWGGTVVSPRALAFFSVQ